MSREHQVFEQHAWLDSASAKKNTAIDSSTLRADPSSDGDSGEGGGVVLIRGTLLQLTTIDTSGQKPPALATGNQVVSRATTTTSESNHQAALSYDISLP